MNQSFLSQNSFLDLHDNEQKMICAYISFKNFFLIKTIVACKSSQAFLRKHSLQIDFKFNEKKLEDVSEIILKKDQIKIDQLKEIEVIHSRFQSLEKNMSSKKIIHKTEEKEKLKEEKARTNNKLFAFFNKTCEAISTLAARKESTVLL